MFLAGWRALARERRRAVCSLIAALLLLLPWAQAQAGELTRGDRLAILYSPQLRFSADREPLIRVGLMDAAAEVRLTANTLIQIDPMGDGALAVDVPANTTLTVRIRGGEPGRYSYAVVVSELPADSLAGAERLVSQWQGLGWDAEVLQVGAVFAVDGQRFDTRKLLIAVGRTPSQAEADSLTERLARERGVDATVHSELADYPGGWFDVSGLPGGVVVHSRDLAWLRGRPETVFTVEDVVYDRGTKGEGKEKRRYVGSLIFAADRGGKLVLVNEVGLERLVEGVLPSEMYVSAPVEALRAQAVAARSEVLGSLGTRYTADPYMTCSDQRCQVYKGIGAETATTSAAARQTRGLVLASGDALIRASFSANNGGFAGGNDTTWGSEPLRYLQPHYDGAEASSKYDGGIGSDAAVAAFLADPGDVLSNIREYGAQASFRWRVELNATQLAEAVAKRQSVGKVRSIRVATRDRSGRATRLEVEGDAGSLVVERELNIRRSLGSLRSALFVLEPTTNAGGFVEKLVIRGGGFGHGVGMCQTGAIGAAQRGWTAEQILERYYPGTSLRNLYAAGGE